MLHSLFSKGRVTAVIVGLSALLGMVGAAHAQGKPLKPVTIALGTQVVNVTYPWLTLPIALGYWKDEGYDVKIVTTGGSLQGIQQMVGGNVDFVQMDSAPLIQANTDNEVAVRGVMNTLVIDWGIGVLQNGPIKSITDFKGKKIGVFSLGTGGMPLLKGYLRANGMDPDKDVQIIATGAGAPALEALRNDRVQGLMFWGSALTGFENAGLDMRVRCRRPSTVTPPWSRRSRAAQPRPRCMRKPIPTARAASTGRTSPAPSRPVPTRTHWPNGIWPS
jgi:NitT/TauT family transport system substrate-binding protein